MVMRKEFIPRTTIFLLAERVSDRFASNPPVVDNLKVATISLLNSRSAFNFCRISNFLRRSNSLKRLRCTRYYTKGNSSELTLAVASKRNAYPHFQLFFLSPFFYFLRFFKLSLKNKQLRLIFVQINHSAVAIYLASAI